MESDYDGCSSFVCRWDASLNFTPQWFRAENEETIFQVFGQELFQNKVAPKNGNIWPLEVATTFSRQRSGELNCSGDFGNESPSLSQHLISVFAPMKSIYLEIYFFAKASQKHDPIRLFHEAHRFRFLWCSLEEETAIQARRTHARSLGTKGSDCGGE